MTKSFRAAELFLQCSRILAEAVPEEEIERNLCDILVKSADFEAAWIGLFEPGGKGPLRLVAYSIRQGEDSRVVEMIQEDCQSLPSDLFSKARSSARQGRTPSQSHPARRWRMHSGMARRHAAGLGKAASDRPGAVALPLLANGHPAGYLCVYSFPEAALGRPKREFLAQLTGIAARVIARPRANDSAVLDAVPDFILLLNAQMDILYSHVPHPDLFPGCPNPDGAHNLCDVFPSNLAAQYTACFQKAMQTGQAQSFCHPAYIKKSLRYWEARAIPCAGGNCLLVLRDTASMESSTAGALRQERQWEHYFNALADPLAILDKDYRILFINKAMAEHLEVAPEECHGRPCHVVMHQLGTPPANCPFTLVLADGREHFAPRCDGLFGEDYEVSVRPYFDDAANLAGGIILARNIAKRQQELQERFRQEQRLAAVQKMESLSLLASEMAHDFNNLLVGVFGNIALIQDELGEQSTAQPLLEQVECAAQRMAELSRQLTAFSGRSALLAKVADLNAIVSQMKDKLQSLAGKDVTIAIRLNNEPLLVDVDESQIREVISNLVENAAEATAGKKGQITLSTLRVKARESDYLDIPWADQLSEGYYAMLEVADNGCGMDAATAKRVFDPFFSTRQSGRGLGLASSSGIVRAHKGFMRVISQPGVGSAFHVLLPIRSGEAPKQSAADAAARSWKAEGTVLVVDDEQPIVRVISHLLKSTGLQVLCANSGFEAIKVFRSHAREIRLAFVDFSMPGMRGDQVAREILSVRPSVNVVLMSGYGDLDLSSQFMDIHLAAFLPKPFLASDFLNLVRRLVEKKA